MTLGRKTAKTNVASFAELNRTLTDTFSELDLFNVSMFQKIVIVKQLVFSFDYMMHLKKLIELIYAGNWMA